MLTFAAGFITCLALVATIIGRIGYRFAVELFE
jgi:hypothetical protein